MRTRAHIIFIVWLLVPAGSVRAQRYRLERVSDSLSVLVLETCAEDGMAARSSRWKLPYPVFRLAVGDVDGDGCEEALVGLVKRTRYSPKLERRLWVMKNVRGRIRPMWLGTRLAGRLVDFCFSNGCIVSLERSMSGRKWAVAEYGWSRFGPDFKRYIIKNVNKDESEKVFRRRRDSASLRGTSKRTGRL